MLGIKLYQLPCLVELGGENRKSMLWQTNVVSRVKIYPFILLCVYYVLLVVQRSQNTAKSVKQFDILS